MSVDDLPMPPSEYRPDKAGECSRFESPDFCRNEDIKRIHMLRNFDCGYDNEVDWEDVEKLADFLDNETLDEPSLASSRSMRDHRIRLGGAIWKLEQEGSSMAHTCTVIPETWTFTPDQLLAIDPRKLIRRMRTALDFADMNVEHSGGWLIGSIHGEYDPNADLFRLHMHFVLSHEYVEAFENLPDYPNYRTRCESENKLLNPVRRRVQISRKPLTNLPEPLTYIAQSYWPSRPVIMLEDGSVKRLRTKARIREPDHSIVLVWLHQWRLADLTLMRGLRATKFGLFRTSS